MGRLEKEEETQTVSEGGKGKDIGGEGAKRETEVKEQTQSGDGNNKETSRETEWGKEGEPRQAEDMAYTAKRELQGSHYG